MATKGGQTVYLDTSVANPRVRSATSTGIVRATPAAPLGRVGHTYKLEPDTHFPAAATRDAIRKVLAEHLETQKYDKEKAPEWARDLAGILRERAKALSQSNRFKVVSYVVIGQNNKSGIAVASRCLWNDKCDTKAEAVFSNSSLYAVGVVYGVYFE